MGTVKCNEDLLAAAIVAQAIEDYYDVCMPYKRRESQSDKSYEMIEKSRKAQKKALEKFFRSDWCYMLSGGMDPEIMIKTTVERRKRGRKALLGLLVYNESTAERLPDAGS